MKLTDENKKFIDDNFQRIPDLIELTRATFKDGTIDEITVSRCSF